MNDQKLFNDIFLEAQAAKIRLADVLKGDEPLKKIVKELEDHMIKIMDTYPYRETDK